MKTLRWRQAWVLGAIILMAAGCNFPGELRDTSPGPATISALTVEAILTKAYVPSETTGPTPTALPIIPGVTETESPRTSSSPQPVECTDRATFVADATIPDNTVLSPGETFLKVWKLQNSGTCTWDSSYRLSFFSGDRMGAVTEITLATIVTSGEVVDLGVDMVAPTVAGEFQGFWRLKNSQGAYFGIGPSGDQSFWVKIAVPGTPTATFTATATSEPSDTATPSPTQPAASPTSTETPTSQSDTGP